MRPRRLDLVIAALACTVLGLASGFYAGQRPGPREAPAEAEPEHVHAVAPATLQSLGVRIEALAAEDFRATTGVAATVVDLPAAQRVVAAPWGGVVRAVQTAPGAIVAGGAVLVTIVRDPIPPPELRWTAGVVAPGQEAVHEAVEALRSKALELDIIRAEHERVREFTGTDGEAPVLPVQRLIDLEAELKRAANGLELARHELEWHGYTDEQIEAVVAGAHVPPWGAQNRRHALRRAGLWGETADTVLAALPERTAESPWASAAVAELFARGLLTPELVRWFAEEPAAARRFPEAAALLLAGRSLADVQRLRDASALEPEIPVAAPALEAGWDVVEVRVRPGSHVAAGEPLAVLRDGRQVALRLTPLGGEVAAVESALAIAEEITATPAFPDAGPKLDDVRLRSLGTDAAGTVVAWATADNQPLVVGGERRGWRVRPGTEYTVHLPVERLADVWVLPAGALVRRGPDTVVLTTDAYGSEFESVPVAVAWRDARHAVLRPSENPELTSDRRIVTAGAFALAMALEGSGHAGHDHGH